MSRKMMFVFVVVMLASVLLTACDGGDGTCASGVYAQDGTCMTREDPTVSKVKETVKDAKDDVQAQMQKAREDAQRAVDKAKKDAQNPKGNPFGASGQATQDMKAYCEDPTHTGTSICK